MIAGLLTRVMFYSEIFGAVAAAGATTTAAGSWS